jgi:hypothetical protein
MERILVNIDSRQRDITLFPQSNHFKLEYNDSYINKEYNELTNTFVNTVSKFINNNYINFKNVDYITLASFEMMNNFNVFQEERFNISFNVTPALVGTVVSGLTNLPKKVVINPGNYNYNDLINNLNKALFDMELNIGYYDVKDDFIVDNGLKFSVNEYTNTIILTNLTNSYSYNINFDNNKYDYVSLGYLLGFRQNNYNIQINGLTGDSIRGEAQADPDGENYLFLKVNDYGSIYISPKLPSKVLAKIVLDATKQGFVFNNGQDLIYKTHKFRQPTDVKSLEIELVDYNGNRMNVNGIDFSFTLEFGIIYDEELYKHKLSDLNLVEKRTTNEMLYNAYDNASTHYSVETPSNKTKNEIVSDVFKNDISITPVPEINKIEKPRIKKSSSKRIKNKFNIQY